jgi:hypothetical protein
VRFVDAVQCSAEVRAHGLVISAAATARSPPSRRQNHGSASDRSTRRPADSGTGSARSGLARSATTKLKV